MTQSGKVFVGFVLTSTGISNPGMTYRDRAMGHCLWMDGKLHEKQPRRPLLYVIIIHHTW
jgi:hypothetical protein